MPGLEGTSLGRYRLKRRLGRGGMAEVYLATDERMRRDVAIKIVSSSQVEFAERFSREAEAMGNLHHDHLLPAYDVGDQGLWHFLVMPYVAQGTLSDYLKSLPGPLDPIHAGELLQQVASGLYYAHQHGLIHRDIKPSNILLRDPHYIYLADFGLARALEGGGDLTQTGTLLGTPEYMAPELSEGPAGKSADTYALAIVLYQMITGRVPFHGDTAISTFWKQLRETPQSPSYYNPNVSKAVDAVLMRALDKDPARRYATPLELSQAYQQAINVLEEMPALYNTEAMSEIPPSLAARPITPLPSATPPTPVQQEKLSLPTESPTPTTPVEKLTPPPVSARPLPASPPPARNVERIADQPAIEGMTQTPISRRRQRRGRRVLATIIMGVLFILIVSGALVYLNFRVNQQNTYSAAATVHTSATNDALTFQTQRANSTRAAQTAVVTTATAQSLVGIHNAEATAGAATGGTPTLSDPLAAQDGNSWPDDGSRCTFQNNAYNVSAIGQDILQPCIATVPQYSNAAIQIEVTISSAADAGLVFRANASQNQFYDFEITNQGEFYLRYFKDNKPTFLISKTSNSAIEGPNAKNTLLVIARGPTLLLFINNIFVGKALDGTFASGQVGVVVGTLSASSGNANFTNLRVYSLR
ncbi:MAG TPA: serine/threonine-protein kinase [Ktedonobacteraceae bacterium]